LWSLDSVRLGGCAIGNVDWPGNQFSVTSRTQRMGSKGRTLFLPGSHVIGRLRSLLSDTVLLDLPLPLLHIANHTIDNMCFDDGDRDNYTTRVTIRNGARYTEEYSDPRCGMSWRRRHGFGGSYYPSRYYSRPPSGRYMSGAMVPSNRYSNYAGYSGYNSYAPGYSHYGAGGAYPRGVVPGGYAGYSPGVYDQAGYQRGVVTGGYAGYSSGYGRYSTGARVAMPRHSAMVSARFFLFSARSRCLVPAHCAPPLISLIGSPATQ
jgi:hypothetical protein